MSPFFSIVVPAYNAEKDLFKLLESIQKQTFTDFEVLIMDGQSKDNTVDVAQSFNDKRFHIYSDADKGIYDAMNKGIELVRGEWVYFIGADDVLYDDEVLSKVAMFISRFSDCMWVYGNVVLKGDGRIVQIYGDGLYAGKFDLPKLLSQNICHQAIFYRKKLVDQIGNYNLYYPILADYDFNLRAFSRYEPKYMDLTVANYNTKGSSNSDDKDPLCIDLPFNTINYFSDKNLFKKDFKPLGPHFASYGRAHYHRDGLFGYLKMKALKLWHKYIG